MHKMSKSMLMAVPISVYIGVYMCSYVLILVLCVCVDICLSARVSMLSYTSLYIISTYIYIEMNNK